MSVSHSIERNSYTYLDYSFLKRLDNFCGFSYILASLAFGLAFGSPFDPLFVLPGTFEQFVPASSQHPSKHHPIAPLSRTYPSLWTTSRLSLSESFRHLWGLPPFPWEPWMVPIPELCVLKNNLQLSDVLEYLLSTQIVGICFVDHRMCVLSTAQSERSDCLLISSSLSSSLLVFGHFKRQKRYFFLREKG